MSGAAGKMQVSRQIILPGPRPPPSKLGDAGWSLDVPNGKVSITGPAPPVTSAAAPAEDSAGAEPAEGKAAAAEAEPTTEPA